MDDFEDRVRRALQHPSSSGDATEILAEVHRAAHHRRQRRTAVAAAGVLAVLTATGALAGPSTGPDRSTDLAAGPSTGPSPAAPDRATATPTPGDRTAAGDPTAAGGAVGFDLATSSGDAFWVSLARCGAQPCSVLHRAAPGGEPEVLHTFEFDTPPSANPDDVPPVESVSASDDGRDLWVHSGWSSGLSGAGGPQLWSSHDAGATWTAQELPGDNPEGRVEVQPVGDRVFAMQSFPSRVWSSPAGADGWSPLALPDGYGYADQLTSLGNDLVVSAMKGDRRMVLLRNASGGAWRESVAPCQGEVGAIRSTGSVLVAPCPGDGSFDDAPLVLWRSWDGETWKPFAGIDHTSYVDATVPVDDDTVFAVTGEGGLLVTEQGQQAVALPVDDDDTTLDGAFSDAEHGLLLVTTPARLLATDDGGRTWAPVG